MEKMVSVPQRATAAIMPLEKAEFLFVRQGQKLLQLPTISGSGGPLPSGSSAPVKCARLPNKGKGS